MIMLHKQQIAGVSKNVYDGQDEGDVSHESSDGGDKSNKEDKKPRKKLVAEAGSASALKLKENSIIEIIKENNFMVNISIVILVIFLAIAVMYFKDDGETLLSYFTRVKDTFAR